MKSKKPRPAARAATSSSSPADPAAAARRRRWFRVVAMLVPLVNLALLEVILRLVGFGCPTSFFVAATVDDRPVFIENQQFSRRYFPPGLERTPQPCVFPAVKPADTIRIFVLGESAAMGDPEPAFGFPRILDVLLREAMPGRRIEVINTAVTAINSHVIREIAKDCADKQGDYWLVYMGNNEVVGPFGAGTVFGRQTPSLGLIRANLALKSTRLGQAMDALLEKLMRKRSALSNWEGMEMFLNQQVTQDDPRLAKVYSHFESNLRDTIARGEKSGAKVLVSTVAVNLKDCPPFASLHRPGLTEVQRAEWEKLYRAAVPLADSTNWAVSLTNAQEAAKLDDRHAELHFQMGRCQGGLGNFNEAKKSFEEARDLDTLRFRADGKINQIIRQVTEGRASHARIEALAAMEQNSPNGIPGEELLYEHVHLNFSGNYLLARAFAEGILGDAAKTSPMLSEADCAQRLAFTDFDRYRVLDEVRQRLQQPPFTAQFDHEGRDRRIKQQLDKLDHASLSNAIALYEQAIARRPDDWVLREDFATLLQDFAQPREAELQWRKVIALLPHSEQGWFGLANLLDTYGHSAEAVTAFREALRRRPNSAEARNGLALALANEGRTAEAIAEFERTLRQNSGFVEARVNLGQTLATQGRTTEAATQYLEVLRLRSNNVPAHVNLGKLLAAEGKLAEAIAHYREAIRLKPGNAVAHYNLGNALTTQGDVAAANAEFAEAVRLNPRLAEAHYNLALGLARLNQSAEALQHFQEAVRLNPNSAESRFNLGVALAREQRFGEAIAEFRETLRLDPNNAMAKKFLEQAQARQQQAP